jgi:hypothetical protein
LDRFSVAPAGIVWLSIQHLDGSERSQIKRLSSKLRHFAASDSAGFKMQKYAFADPFPKHFIIAPDAFELMARVGTMHTIQSERLVYVADIRHFGNSKPHLPIATPEVPLIESTKVFENARARKRGTRDNLIFEHEAKENVARLESWEPKSERISFCPFALPVYEVTTRVD